MGKIISGLSKEEEGLTASLVALRDTHQRDFRRQIRLSTLMTVVDSDLQMLEDILSSIMSSVAPSRLSAYLAFKSGLPFASTFTYVDTTHMSSTVTVAYESFLYHEVPMLSCQPSVNSSSLVLQTSTNRYLIHPGHPDPQLLSAREVSYFVVVMCRGLMGVRGSRGEGWEMQFFYTYWLFLCFLLLLNVFLFAGEAEDRW